MKIMFLILAGFLFGCSTQDDNAVRALRNHDPATKSGNWQEYKFGVDNYENVTTLLNNLHKNQLALTKVVASHYFIYVWVPQCGELIDCKEE